MRRGLFIVELSGDCEGVALAGQVTCIDWRNRKAVKKGKVTADELALIRAKARVLMG